MSLEHKAVYMQLTTNVFALMGIIPRGISLSRIKINLTLNSGEQIVFTWMLCTMLRQLDCLLVFSDQPLI